MEARPIIMLYDGMTRWAFDHVDINKEAIVNAIGNVLASLNPERV